MDARCELLVNLEKWVSLRQWAQHVPDSDTLVGHEAEFRWTLTIPTDSRR